MEFLLKEVAMECEVDQSIVLECMNKLWEVNLKYDDMDTLCRAVEEVVPILFHFIIFKMKCKSSQYKTSHAIEGKPRGKFTKCLPFS